jgi:acetyl-CoA C-acetyltransferase
MKDIVIVSAVRTPIGRFGGALGGFPAHQLGAIAIRAALERASVGPGEADEVTMGQVLTAGMGMNPARQAAVAAGIPFSATAFGVNQVCGSGMRAIVLAAQSLQLGDADIVVAGGQESMSNAPHCVNMRAGTKLGDAMLVDTMIRDGLWDAFNGYHMGQTAENVAQQWKIDRAEQDEFALQSHRKAAAAQQAGYFQQEIVPVRLAGPKGEIVVQADESVRADTTAEALAKLRPVFTKDGTVTAGNASSLNDGAAALVLMRAEEAKKRNTVPLGRLVSWATTGVDPAVMGIGPVSAVRRALEKADWKLDSIDLIEANEAFAAQSCAIGRELKWDPARVNIYGGAIALGHPIGASGARIVVTLLNALQRRKAHRGLATLCIGGGMGIALCVERLDFAPLWQGT